MRKRLPALVVTFAIAATAVATAPSAGGATGTSPVREAAVKWAMSQVGTREIGTSNCSPKINRWERNMGFRVPPCKVWCGAFVHEAFLQAGVKLSPRLIDPHRSYQDAIAGVRGLKRIAPSQIQRGDIVFYKFRQGVLASHLAIARGSPRNGKLDTVEGNVGNASSLQTRGVKYIVLAARVTGAG